MPTFKGKKQVFHKWRAPALLMATADNCPLKLGEGGCQMRDVRWGGGAGSATPVWGFCHIGLTYGIQGVQNTSELCAKFSVLLCIFLGRVLQSSYHMLWSSVIHSYPRPQNEEPWRFITVYHVMVYNAVIKDKELDPFTFALTWRDWTHSLLMKQKQVSEWRSQNGPETSTRAGTA